MKGVDLERLGVPLDRVRPALVRRDLLQQHTAAAQTHNALIARLRTEKSMLLDPMYFSATLEDPERLVAMNSPHLPTADDRRLADEVRRLRQAVRAVDDEIHASLVRAIADGELIVTGREEPFAGERISYHHGSHFLRVRLQFDDRSIYTRREPHRFIHDVRLVPRLEYERACARVAAVDTDPLADRQALDVTIDAVVGHSRFAIVDRRALIRLIELHQSGQAVVSANSRQVYAEMIRDGVSAADLGSNEEATLKRWQRQLSKILPPSPSALANPQRAAKRQAH